MGKRRSYTIVTISYKIRDSYLRFLIIPADLLSYKVLEGRGSRYAILDNSEGVKRALIEDV